MLKTLEQLETSGEVLRDFLLQGPSRFLPNLSVDSVVFAYSSGNLKVLLIKNPFLDVWGLPGGFIFKGEDLNTAAERILEERTCLTDIFLRQFNTFGSAKRKNDPSGLAILTELGFEVKDVRWIFDRFVTIGYYALVHFEEAKPQKGIFGEEPAWFNVDQLPQLYLDHEEITLTALKSLRKNIKTDPFWLALLPPRFTLPELRKVYEAILGKSLDRRNFQRKILAMEILKRHEKRMDGSSHRAPFEYSLDKEKYYQKIEMEEMLVF